MPLSAAAREVWDEIVAADNEASQLEGAALEAYCIQVARMRAAAGRVDQEGLIVADPKGEPTMHPALEVERRAHAEIRAWQKLLLEISAHRARQRKPGGDDDEDVLADDGE